MATTQQLSADGGTREDVHDLQVGQRFAKADKCPLAVEAEEKADVPVLLVCGASADRGIPAAGHVYGLEGTAGLLTTVSALLSEKMGSAPQAAAESDGKLYAAWRCPWEVHHAISR
jgi:hypothetical protein